MNRLPLPLEIAIKAKSKDDRNRLVVALARLTAHDSSFGSTTDQESGQTLLSGVSEDQLDAAIDILRRTYKVDANIGAPQVAYREKLTKRTESITPTRNRPAARVSSPK
jgi:elongation factor G